MIIALYCLLTMTATAIFIEYFERKVEAAKTAAHQHETAALKKVGKWQEGRIFELENETRQLAEQVVASGGIRQYAMPTPAPADLSEYAYDETGLVREKLDPREVTGWPVG